MAFEKGKPRLPNAGRKAGTPNKVTATVRETFARVFNDLQEDPKVNLHAWGKANPTEFYKLSGKLIPADINAKIEGQMSVFVVSTGVPAEGDDLV